MGDLRYFCRYYVLIMAVYLVVSWAGYPRAINRFESIITSFVISFTIAAVYIAFRRSPPSTKE